MKSLGLWKDHRGIDCWATIAAAVVAILMIVAATQVQAQTLTVLHTFMGDGDGSTPMAGPTADAGGNLYVTAERGSFFDFCSPSCGTVLKLVRHGSAWLTTPIYALTGPPDGATPTSRVVFGPDGALYGTTMYGGSGSCVSTVDGCGTVFKLQPSPTTCRNTLCPWRETILYSFATQSDGENPQAEVAFDQAGNIYGTTYLGGTGPCNNGGYLGCGSVFQLTHNPDGSWSKSTLHSFRNSPNDGAFPYAGVTLDQAGNIYGTAGGGTNGIVFELTPSGSGWTETVVHFFNGTDGSYPQGGLIIDNQGNLYGATEGGGGAGQGAVYELSPVQGGWTFAVLYSFSGQEAAAPAAKLTMDGAGNLYGSSTAGGIYQGGTIYKLTPSNGSWNYSTVYNLGADDGLDGFAPYGSVLFDAEGNIYDTASQGPYPDPDSGTVFEITPN